MNVKQHKERKKCVNRYKMANKSGWMIGKDNKKIGKHYTTGKIVEKSASKLQNNIENDKHISQQGMRRSLTWRLITLKSVDDMSVRNWRKNETRMLFKGCRRPICAEINFCSEKVETGSGGWKHDENRGSQADRFKDTLMTASWRFQEIWRYVRMVEVLLWLTLCLLPCRLRLHIVSFFHRTLESKWRNNDSNKAMIDR